jgi:hypothetical protein
MAVARDQVIDLLPLGGTVGAPESLESLGVRGLRVRSFIHALRFSFAHSEQHDWQHKKSIKLGSWAPNARTSS